MKFEITILLTMALLLGICGCSRKNPPSTANNFKSWESQAKGYDTENARPVFGSTGYTRLCQSTSDGQLFDFSLKVGPPKDWSRSKAQVVRFWGWGQVSTEPEELRAAEHVLEMSLVLGSDPVLIREECYIDLVDLRVGSNTRFLKKDGPRVLLYLEGADAGESYRVKFTIEDLRITKREVWEGEFPEMGPETKCFERPASCQTSNGIVTPATSPTK